MLIKKQVNLDSVQFIDGAVEEGNITASEPRNMPLRQFTHLDYNFTKE